MTLNDKQQRRAEILSRLTSGTLTTVQAAQLLGVSVQIPCVAAVEQAKTAFGENTFEEEFKAGRGLTSREAVSLALGRVPNSGEVVE